MLSIVGERERAAAIADAYLEFDMVWIEDLMNVATFARAAEVQCWIQLHWRTRGINIGVADRAQIL